MSVRIVCCLKGRGIMQIVRKGYSGKIHKTLGTYDTNSKTFRRFDAEAYAFLLKNGAQPSKRVQSIVLKTKTN